MSTQGPIDHTTSGTVIRADLVEQVRELGFTREQATGHVKEIFSIFDEVLERGEPVKLSGFGRFEVLRQKARSVPNPSTGGSLELPCRNTVVFRPASAFRSALTEALRPPADWDGEQT